MGTAEQFEKFKETKRGDEKLRIGLEEYKRLEREGQREEPWSAYREYLRSRRRAAWEVLIDREDLEGLRLFAKEGWLTAQDLPACFALADRAGKRESQLWLLRFQRDLEGLGRRKEEAAEAEFFVKESELSQEIHRIVEQTLRREIPSLASAFPYLTWKEEPEASWGTDGNVLYFSREELLSLFQKGTRLLCRKYLHSLCHCLYLHMLTPRMEEQERDWWDLACDLAVERTLEESGWFPLEERKAIRKNWYESLQAEQGAGDTRSCYAWIRKLASQGKQEFLKEMKAEFQEDSHQYWRKNSNASFGSRQLANDEGLLGTWSRARQSLSMELAGEGARRGTRAGSGEELYQAGKRKTYDYRKFLRRFSLCREELQLDLTSFDYIPYYYGLQRYGNVVLMEPLETTEVNRLEELVIAIDTSGSCSGEIVRRFLDETYSILSSRENFFRKMNVHIIQCDSMIQDHRKITCEEEWKDYLEHVKIQGLGGTDFTPVFRLTDHMLETGEIRRLKCLLYFTDGDGIYPNQKPHYETAFVFLNHALEKQKIPSWAIRLNLDMPLS